MRDRRKKGRGKGARPHTASYLPIDTESTARSGRNHHLPPPERDRGRVGRLQTYEFPLHVDVVRPEGVSLVPLGGHNNATVAPLSVGGGDLDLEAVVLDVLVGHRDRRVHPLQRRLQLRGRFDGEAINKRYI